MHAMSYVSYVHGDSSIAAAVDSALPLIWGAAGARHGCYARVPVVHVVSRQDIWCHTAGTMLIIYTA